MPVPGSRGWIELELWFSCSLTKALAADCEMVGVGPRGEDSIVARVSLVNQYGKCVYDKYVKPTQPVTDYRTAVSGIRPDDLAQGGCLSAARGGGGWSAFRVSLRPFLLQARARREPGGLPPSRAGGLRGSRTRLRRPRCLLATRPEDQDSVPRRNEAAVGCGMGGRRDRLEGLPGLREGSETGGRPWAARGLVWRGFPPWGGASVLGIGWGGVRGWGVSPSSVPLVREVAVQGSEPWPSSGDSLDAEPVGFADGQAVGGGHRGPRGAPDLGLGEVLGAGA